MRIAAISDIHGNLRALDAVLAHIERRGVDLTVVIWATYSRDRSSPLKPPIGSWRSIFQPSAEITNDNCSRRIASPWANRIGTPPTSSPIASENGSRRCPATRWIGDEVFLCHATPDSDVACYLEDIRDGELFPAPLTRIEERTAGCRASLIVCGHTHIPRNARLGSGQTIVNPGSVGIQAYDGHHPIAHTVEIGSPHARYAIVERTASGWLTEHIAVP